MDKEQKLAAMAAKLKMGKRVDTEEEEEEEGGEEKTFRRPLQVAIKLMRDK
jgi:hypothetical protein